MPSTLTRTALVTGGGTGIGRAVAHRLASDGDDVVIVGRRAEVLAEAAAAINADTGSERVSTEVADLVDPAAVEQLAARLPERIDVLVHNAGGNVAEFGSQPDTLTDLADEWQQTIALNVTSAVMLTEAVQDRLPDREGRIVAMSSVAALRGATSAYAAAKGALNVWVTGLAAELAPRGVTVNAVAAGFVPDTGFWAGVDDDVLQARVDRTPLGRPGRPEEVASLIVYLASPEAGFTTGQVVGIHGGMVLARL